MNANLPSEMKRKLGIVRRSHNTRLLIFLAIFIPAVFGGIRLVAYVERHIDPGSRIPLITFTLCVVVIGVLMLRSVFRHDAFLCRQLGLVCPHCSRTLYEPSLNLLTVRGECPRCKKPVLQAFD
jgi:hypothetical protein